MGITWAKTMGVPYKKILFHQCVVKQWYHIGSFIGQTMRAPLNTNEWQTVAFTWAISWANWCEAHVIPICGETVVIHGRCHGPTMWNPSNANAWQNSGLTWAGSWANQNFTWAISWVNQCEAHVIPMFGKAVSLHRQVHESTNVNPMQC